MCEKILPKRIYGLTSIKIKINGIYGLIWFHLKTSETGSKKYMYLAEAWKEIKSDKVTC